MKRKRKSVPDEDKNDSSDTCDSEVSFTDNAEENDGFIEYKLRTIMYIKGDAKEPRRDSVATMQSILRKEMNILLAEAEQAASIQKSEEITHEHVLYLMRRNRMKLKRLLEHLKVMDKSPLLMIAGNTNDDDTIPPKSGKRFSKCIKFLQELGGFREFISTLHEKCVMDPTTRMRLEWRNLLVKYMTASEYIDFSKESSRATFCPRQQIWAFKEWLFQDRVTYFNITPLAVTIVEFLALETVAVIIDAAIHIQTKKRGIGHILTHKTKFEFKVPKPVGKPVNTRKEVPHLPSIRVNQDVCMEDIHENGFIKGSEETNKSLCVSRIDENIPLNHSVASRGTSSVSSNDSDYLCSISGKLQLNTPVENTSFQDANEFSNLASNKKPDSDSNASSESIYLIVDEASNLSSASNRSTSNNSSVGRTEKLCSLDVQEQIHLYRRFHSKMSGESSSNFPIPLNFNIISEINRDTKLLKSTETPNTTDKDVEECNLESNCKTSTNCESVNDTNIPKLKTISDNSQNSVEIMDSDGSIPNHNLNNSSQKAVESPSPPHIQTDSYAGFLSKMSGENCSNFLASLNSNPISEPNKNKVFSHFADNLNGSITSHDLNSTKIAGESQDDSYRYFLSKMSSDSSSNFLAPPKSNSVSEQQERTKPSLFADSDTEKCETSSKNDANISSKCNSVNEAQNSTPSHVKPKAASSNLSNPPNVKPVSEVLEKRKSVFPKIALKIDGKIYLVSESDMQILCLKNYENGSPNPLPSSKPDEETTHTPSTSSSVNETKKDNKHVSFTDKGIKKCKTFVEKDAKTSVEHDSVNEACSSKLKPTLKQVNINSSGVSNFPPDNVEKTSEIPITSTPVTDIRKDSKAASTKEDVETHKTSLKEDAEISEMSDSSNEASCGEKNINSSHYSFSSTCPEETSSKIPGITKPSVASGVKKNNGCAPCTDKNIIKSSGSLGEDAEISPICPEGTTSKNPGITKPSVASEVKNDNGCAPSTAKNVKKKSGSVREDPEISPICPGGTSSKNLAVTKPSIVSEVTNNNRCAPSTSKSVKNNSGSLREDAEISSMSDSDVELPSPRKTRPLSSLVSPAGVSLKTSAATKLSVVSEVNSNCAPSTSKNDQKYTGSLKVDAVICAISDSDAEFPCFQETVNSVQISSPKSNDTTEDTQQTNCVTENISAYASQQRKLFKRVPLTPEEITEAYLELQETSLIYSWFTGLFNWP